MHSVGRLLSRSIVSGLYNCSSTSSRTNGTNATSEAPVAKLKPKLVSAVAGFPKDFKNGKVRKGQIGDDAWIISNADDVDILGIILVVYFPLFLLRFTCNSFMQLWLMELVGGEIMV